MEQRYLHESTRRLAARAERANRRRSINRRVAGVHDVFANGVRDGLDDELIEAPRQAMACCRMVVQESFVDSVIYPSRVRAARCRALARSDSTCPIIRLGRSTPILGEAVPGLLMAVSETSLNEWVRPSTSTWSAASQMALAGDDHAGPPLL